jgi:leucyl aminopeptidase
MIKLTGKDPLEFEGDLLVFFVEEGDGKSELTGEVVRKAISRAWAAGDFLGKKEQRLLIYPEALAGEDRPPAAKRVLIVGLGRQDEQVNQRREQLRIAAGVAAREGGTIRAEEALVVLPKDFALSASDIAECISEGLLLANYRFDRHKTVTDPDDQPKVVGGFVLHDGGLAASSVRKGMNRGRIQAEAVCAARDMANEPGNFWTPTSFADYAKTLAKKSNLKYRILEKSNLKKLGMGGILGVNQGSAEAPKLVIVEYRTDRKNPTLLLVGKGLTFDSGGISLKPAAGMEEMKYDMCGGAAVLTALQAIAEEAPTGINVIGLVPATENLSGSAAIKPGDIVTHYGGKTSEVVNTDAEGRLILADALAYGIETYQPDAVIDLATLTGAVIVGLGHHRTGLFANDDALADQLVEAGDLTAEPMWRLPLGPEYRKQIKSQVADIKNVGGKEAGAITAACFLQEFVGETPWAHLDIAGTAWSFTEKSYIPKGPSGIGPRTLVALARNWKPLKKD